MVGPYVGKQMPYRELAVVEKIEDNLDVIATRPEVKPKYGRLPGLGPQLPHHCILPIPSKMGWLARLFGAKETFQFKIGDLFRCECGAVYRFVPFDQRNDGYRKDGEWSIKNTACKHAACRYILCEWWNISSIKEWKLAGGEE